MLLKRYDILGCVRTRKNKGSTSKGRFHSAPRVFKDDIHKTQRVTGLVGPGGPQARNLRMSNNLRLDSDRFLVYVQQTFSTLGWKGRSVLPGLFVLLLTPGKGKVARLGLEGLLDRSEVEILDILARRNIQAFYSQICTGD